MRRTLFAGILALMAAPGCLTSTQATRLQTDLDDVKKQLFQVQQQTAGSQQKLATIENKLESGGPSSADQADLMLSMHSLLDQVQILSERIQEMESRLAGLQGEIRSRSSQSVSSSPAVSSPTAPTPAVPMTGGAAGRREAQASSTVPVSPPGPGAETFNDAYADYSKGNYELAMMGFADFLQTHPDHVLAPDAQYWIGESLYSQGKFKDAAEAFDRTVGQYPGCNKVPVAMLKKGFAQMELGQTSRAVTTLQALIEDHPRTDEARIAADRLKELGLRAP